MNKKKILMGVVVGLVLLITSIFILHQISLNNQKKEIKKNVIEKVKELGLKDVKITEMSRYTSEIDTSLLMYNFTIDSSNFANLSIDEMLRIGKELDDIEGALLISYTCKGDEYNVSVDQQSVRKNGEIINSEYNQSAQNNSTIDKTKKMEILSYINGILDPLSETNMNDEQLEEKANEVWIDAEAKFQITENDIFDVMADMDLTKEYYTKIENESGEKITSYDAVLNSNNYGRIVVAKTKDGLTQYDKAMSANDNDKVSKLLFDGEIALLENDLKANILDFGIATTKVTVLEGLYKGYTGYIITEQVDRK